MRDSELVTCEACGMSWFTRAMCSHCAFRSGGADPACETCHGTGEAGLTKAHECPPPFPFETARMMAAQAAATPGGITVSQRTKARIRLGLERGPS